MTTHRVNAIAKMKGYIAELRDEISREPPSSDSHVLISRMIATFERGVEQLENMDQSASPLAVMKRVSETGHEVLKAAGFE